MSDPDALTINPLTDPRWAELTAGAPAGLFVSPRFLRAVADSYRLELAARVLVDRGRPCAGIAYCVVDDPLGVRLVSTPFCDVSSPVVEDQTTWRRLVDPLLEEGRPSSFRTLGHPVVLADERLAVARTAVMHEVELPPGGHNPATWYHPHTRRHVGRCSRSPLVLRASSDREDLRDFFLLHLRVRKEKYRLLAQPYAFFEALWDGFVAKGDGTLIGAFDRDRLIAGALILVHGDTASYKFAASDPAYRRQGVNHAVADALLRWAAEHNLRRVDLGRSDLDQAGLLRFKEGLGARAIPLTVHYWAPRHQPSDPTFASTLQSLTAALTAPEVPDHLTERAGSMLYRFFA